MLNIKYFFCNPYRERCYVIWDESGHGAVIDPGFMGDETEGFHDFIAQEHIRLDYVLLTHVHFDHIYGVAEISRRYGCPVMMHPGDKPLKDNMATFARSGGMPVPDTSWETTDIREGDRIRIGGEVLEVIETPGHSEGGVCYLDREARALFSGDTLFAGAIGRSDLMGGDYDKEIVSIMEKLIWLDADIEVHPGHGGSTTIADERTHNPFLQPFNEIDQATGAVDGIEVHE